MIRAGSHGAIRVGSQPIARCTQWTLSMEKETRDRTPIYQWDERSIPLGRSGVGRASIMYDPTDPGVALAISSFRSNEPPPLELQLRTDRFANKGYDCDAHISSVGTAIAVQSGHVLTIEFAVTGPITIL